jgi:hypothetical protein
MTLTNSVYTAVPTDNAAVLVSDLGSETAASSSVADEFVFNTGADDTGIDAADAYILEDYGQSCPASDAEYQTSCDTFMFDWIVNLDETGSFADSSFI